jgi:hypothetical protein
MEVLAFSPWRGRLVFSYAQRDDEDALYKFIFINGWRCMQLLHFMFYVWKYM